MLGNFKYKSVAYSLNLKGIENRREVTLKLHIHDGTNDLGDSSQGRLRTAESSYIQENMVSVD